MKNLISKKENKTMLKKNISILIFVLLSIGLSFCSNIEKEKNDKMLAIESIIAVENVNTEDNTEFQKQASLSASEELKLVIKKSQDRLTSNELYRDQNITLTDTDINNVTNIMVDMNQLNDISVNTNDIVQLFELTKDDLSALKIASTMSLKQINTLATTACVVSENTQTRSTISMYSDCYNHYQNAVAAANRGDVWSWLYNVIYLITHCAGL